MDPIRLFCRIDATVTPENSRDVILNNIVPFSFEGTFNLIKSKNKRVKNENIPIIDDGFFLGDLSPFKYLTSYELASIDIYFDINDHGSANIAPQLLKAQTYIMISKDLGYLDYLQYRNPLSFIFLFDFIDVSETINNFIVYDRIKQINNQSEFNIDYYTNHVLTTTYQGVDIFILNDYKSIKELIMYIIVMIRALKQNGTGVIRLKTPSEDIVQMMTYIFDHIFLFKPAVNNINNGEYFLICKFYNKNKSTRMITFLTSILDTSIDEELLIDVNKKTYNYINNTITNVNIEILNDPVYIPNKLKFYLNII